MLLALQIGGFGHQAHGCVGVSMGNSQPQCIGGIGAGQAGQLQQAAHHLLHLAFGGAAMARLGESATLQRRQHAMFKGGRSY